MKPNTLSTATALLKNFSVADIEARLHELSEEEKALRTILRSLKARDRERAKATRHNNALNRPIGDDDTPTVPPSEVSRG